MDGELPMEFLQVLVDEEACMLSSPLDHDMVIWGRGLELDSNPSFSFFICPMNSFTALSATPFD